MMPDPPGGGGTFRGMPKWVWYVGGAVIGIGGILYYRARKNAQAQQQQSGYTSGAQAGAYGSPLPGAGVLQPILLQQPISINEPNQPRFPPPTGCPPGTHLNPASASNAMIMPIGGTTARPLPGASCIPDSKFPNVTTASGQTFEWVQDPRMLALMEQQSQGTSGYIQTAPGIFTQMPWYAPGSKTGSGPVIQLPTGTPVYTPVNNVRSSAIPTGV